MTRLGDLGSALFGALYANAIPVGVLGGLSVLALALVARRRGWLRAARRHPSRSLAAIVVLAVVALPVGWYLASPLVLSASIDEPAPSIQVPPSSRPAVATAVPGSGRSPVPPSAATTPAPSAAALIARSGAFHGSDDFHFGRGTARLIETAPGTFTVRLEGFAVRNGPDLYVYLSPDATGYADGAVELGRLKADTGNQNYAVPKTAADPGSAASVVIWCKQFSHLFATAPLDA